MGVLLTYESCGKEGGAGVSASVCWALVPQDEVVEPSSHDPLRLRGDEVQFHYIYIYIHTLLYYIVVVSILFSIILIESQYSGLCCGLMCSRFGSLVLAFLCVGLSGCPYSGNHMETSPHQE